MVEGSQSERKRQKSEVKIQKTIKKTKPSPRFTGNGFASKANYKYTKTLR
jgi:hypothetical protein